MGLGFGARETVRWRMETEAETVTLRFYVATTLSQVFLSKINGVINLFRVEGKRETSNFRCVLAGLLGEVRNQIFGACWRDCSARCSAETRSYSVF